MANPSPPPSKEPAARRGYHHGHLRDALLGAARDLVAERGPRGFTLVEAARRAGVSPSAPYRHFKDREEVMETLRTRGFALFGQRLREAAAAAESPAAAIRRMAPVYLAFAREEPGYYAAMFAFRAPGTPIPAPTTISQAAAAAEDDPFATLARVVAAALRPEGGADPRLVALQISALSHGMAMLEQAGLPADGADGPAAEAVLQAGMEALLRRS